MRRIRQSTICRTIFLQDSMPWHLWFNLLSRGHHKESPRWITQPINVAELMTMALISYK
jgi:hypothetical protein